MATLCCPNAHWHCASTRPDHPESCSNTDDTSGTRGSTPSNLNVELIVVHCVVVMANMSAAEGQHVWRLQITAQHARNSVLDSD